MRAVGKAALALGGAGLLLVLLYQTNVVSMSMGGGKAAGAPPARLQAAQGPPAQGKLKFSSNDKEEEKEEKVREVIKEVIKEVPVIKEVIKEVPVVKEVVKEVPVVKEVTKEVIKEVPVVKEVVKNEPPPVLVIPPKATLEAMSHADLQVFYHRYVNSPQITCNGVERMGLITDGGWEHCVDPRWAPDPSNCLVYSYGINFDFSYDDDMERYGCEVHAFDPSMNQGSHLRGRKVHFHNEGVAGSDRTARNMGSRHNQDWTLHTIQTTRKLLNHAAGQRRVDVVKMDVEGWELESLSSALDAGALDDVRQLNFESHVDWGNKDPSRENYLKFLEMYRKVYDHGFRIYLTHRNYMYSAFSSRLSHHGKKRVLCHEVHTVNVNIINQDWQEKHAQGFKARARV